MPKPPQKTETIIVRATSQVVRLIDKAARMLGVTRSEFIRRAAKSEADKVIKSNG